MSLSKLVRRGNWFKLIATFLLLYMDTVVAGAARQWILLLLPLLLLLLLLLPLIMWAVKIQLLPYLQLLLELHNCCNGRQWEAMRAALTSFDVQGPAAC